MANTHTFKSVDGGYPTFQTTANNYNSVETRPPTPPTISKMNATQVRFTSGAYSFTMDVSVDTCTINTTDTGGASTPYSGNDASSFFKALNQLYTTNNITL